MRISELVISQPYILYVAGFRTNRIVKALLLLLSFYKYVQLSHLNFKGSLLKFYLHILYRRTILKITKSKIVSTVLWWFYDSMNWISRHPRTNKKQEAQQQRVCSFKYYVGRIGT